MDVQTAELLREIKEAGGQWQYDEAKADDLNELHEAGFIAPRTLVGITKDGETALNEHDAAAFEAEAKAQQGREAELEAERIAAEAAKKTG